MQSPQQDHSPLLPHALCLSVTTSRHFWKAHGVKLIKKACVSLELWDLDSIKTLLVLGQFPLLLCGYLLGLVPCSRLQPLPTPRPACDVAPVVGCCRLLGPCPDALQLCDAQQGLALPWCSPCWPAQSLRESFHAVRLLFISAHLPPHY